MNSNEVKGFFAVESTRRGIDKWLTHNLENNKLIKLITKIDKLVRIISYTYEPLSKMNGYIEELKDRVNDLSSNNNYLKEIFEKQANWSLTSLARAYRIINGLNQTSNQKITRYLIATQSRSGTKHIDSFLRNAYGLCSETLPQHYHSPASLGSSILPKFFEDSEFLYGNSFASDHILPGPKLQQLILGFRIPTIVQMRNPAQSCVSLYFNLIESKFITTDTYVPGLQYGPALIENNDSLRSHLIKNIFPRTVAFVRLWMKSLKSLKSLKFAESVPLILFHEQLVNDPIVFHRKIHNYLGFNVEFDPKLIEEKKAYNFGKGSVDEWKEFYTSSELSIIQSSVDELKRSFPLLEEYWQ